MTLVFPPDGFPDLGPVTAVVSLLHTGELTASWLLLEQDMLGR